MDPTERRPRHDLSWFWGELMSCEGDLARLLDVITRRVAEVVGEAAVLTVVADDGVTLQPEAFHHADPQVLAAMAAVLITNPYRIGEGIVGTVAADRQPVMLSNLDADTIVPVLASGTLPFLEQYPIRSMLIVPLVAYGELVGTLGAMRVHSREAYTDNDLLVLESLAERAALAVATARRAPRPLGLEDYEAIFRHSLEGVMFTVPDGRILAANPAACAILQRSEAEICRVGRAGLLVNDDPRVKQGVEQRALTGSVRAEVPLIRGDGQVFIAELASTTFTTAAGELRACVFFRDVSEQVALRERLERERQEHERLAEEDPLSGLLNRRGFRTAAQRALTFADRERVPVQLVFIDVDDLKGINDEHGHRTGDTVLTRLGGAIAAAVRQVDVAARLSGDEFAVMLYGATSDEVAVVLDRIASELAGADAHGPAVTFSAGVADRAPGSDLSLDALIELADQQMYTRKTLRRIERHRDTGR